MTAPNPFAWGTGFSHQGAKAWFPPWGTTSSKTTTGFTSVSLASTICRPLSRCYSLAPPRVNYLLRILSPHLTATYAAAHDAAVAHCLATLLEHEAAPLPDHSLRTAQLAQFSGILASALPPPIALPCIEPRGATPCPSSMPVPQRRRTGCLVPSAATTPSPRPQSSRRPCAGASARSARTAAAPPPQRVGETSREPWPFRAGNASLPAPAMRAPRL